MRKYENTLIEVECVCPKKVVFEIEEKIQKGSQKKKTSTIQVFCPFCDKQEMEVTIRGKIAPDREVHRGE